MVAFFVYLFGFLEYLCGAEVDAESALFASLFDNVYLSSENFHFLAWQNFASCLRFSLAPRDFYVDRRFLLDINVYKCKGFDLTGLKMQIRFN